MVLSANQVRESLAAIVEPDTGKTVGDLGLVQDVVVRDAAVEVQLRLPTPATFAKDALTQQIRNALQAKGVTSVKVEFEFAMTSRSMSADDPCPDAKNILLVMSGKGGVGKSTVATNVALALTRSGASVGLLDADMYGPSIPTMLGVGGRPVSADGKKFLPLERFGLKLMSLGFMLPDPRAAVVWRGPMLTQALMQFFRDVDWGPLDYLVLDLPPGTGDVALTISQKVRGAGAIIVTTPQEVALQDVYKSVSMAQKVGIPILGVVENESYFVCDGCDKRHELFGSGGGKSVADFAQAPLLGQIPLIPAIREWGDAGTPIVHAAPESPAGKALTEVAYRTAARITLHNLSGDDQLPVIDRSGGKNRHLPIAR